LQQSWDNTSGSDIDVIITAPDNKADNMQDAKVLYLEAQYIFNKAKAENKMTEEIKEKFRNALRNYQQLRREFLNK
jgi:soluble P-type ATPase